jgi:hypothetical protein
MPTSPATLQIRRWRGRLPTPDRSPVRTTSSHGRNHNSAPNGPLHRDAQVAGKAKLVGALLGQYPEWGPGQGIPYAVGPHRMTTRFSGCD